MRAEIPQLTKSGPLASSHPLPAEFSATCRSIKFDDDVCLCQIQAPHNLTKTCLMEKHPLTHLGSMAVTGHCAIILRTSEPVGSPAAPVRLRSMRSARGGSFGRDLMTFARK